MGDSCLEIIRICQKVQRTIISPAAPLHSLVRYREIAVVFPSQHDSVTRIQDIVQRTEPSRYMAIAELYWRTCCRLRNGFEEEYENFCRSAPSMEQFGGISDLELQSQVARGFATRYRQLEEKLAQVVFKKCQRKPQAVESKQTINRNPAKVSSFIFRNDATTRTWFNS